MLLRSGCRTPQQGACTCKTTKAAPPPRPQPRAGSANESLSITRNDKFPGGVAVDGFPLIISNQSNADRTAMLHITGGMLVPPSQRPILQYWLANGHGNGTKGAAVAIITATYNGMPPDNAAKFMKWLASLESDGKGGENGKE